MLSVPIKAVRQSLDPAGGAQLQAIVEALPFWPSREELQAASELFLGGLNKAQGTRLRLPELAANPAIPPNQQPTAGPAASQGEEGVAASSEAWSNPAEGPSLSASSQLPPDTSSRDAKV